MELRYIAKQRKIGAMMQENRVNVKAPFKERWAAFKEAYYEWARYNPYKVYPLPNRNVIWNRIEKETEIPMDFVAETTVLAKIRAKVDFIYKNEIKRRKAVVKNTKKRLRGNLKETFLDLF